MKKETLSKAKEIEKEIKDLSDHILNFNLRSAAPQGVNIAISSNGYDEDLRKDLYSHDDFIDLYRMRASQKLARLEKELEDLRD